MSLRPAAVAGTFYPREPGVLAGIVDELVAAVPPSALASPAKAFVTPHAGYVFSGTTAAYVYAECARRRDSLTRVVLLGPAHRVPVRGCALTGADTWETPLGPVAIDVDARDRLRALPGVEIDDVAHAGEHCLEVQLPFIQRVLDPSVRVLPILVGGSAPEAVARVLDAVWGGDETVVIVSSDLSHYLSYSVAVARDHATAGAIVAGDWRRLDAADACGATPLRGLLVAGARHGLHGALLDLRNSGDTNGPKDRVVGYGAFAFA